MIDFIGNKKNYSLIKLSKCLILTNLLISFASSSYVKAATQRTPSQILPETFKEQGTIKDLDSRKQKELFPAKPVIKDNQQEKIDIKIIPKTLIILAPDQLQDKINFNIYKDLIINKEISIEDLYTLANQITNEFSSAGFPLVRAIIPKQELRAEEATVFVKVIDGFIERIDMSKVPKLQALRTYAYFKPLKNKKALTKKELERQLILAGNSAGLTIKSGFLQGKKEGGSILVLEGDHKLFSGSIQFNNTQSEELGRQLGQKSLTINSPAGFGESITFFGLSRPTKPGAMGAGKKAPIRGGGISLSIPIGSNGLSSNFSYVESMTRPGGDILSLGLEANNKTATATVSYPLLVEPSRTWFLKGTLNWNDEIQQTSASGEIDHLSHDRVTSLRLGATYNGCKVGCINFDAEISRGIDLISRSSSEVGEGTPLSRASSTSAYHHMKVKASYSFYPYKDIFFELNGGAQYTDDPLLNSEQSTIVGEDRISGLTSGAISGDKTWYFRAQADKEVKFTETLSFSPYIYSAMGVAYLNRPTATEEKETAAKSIGLGVKFQAYDKYFFDKSITAKAEITKTWATGFVEEVSDVRLNKEQLLLSLAMTF